MTQHPEEGTLHAYIDGELSAAEAATLELHVGECSLCAAALAEARGFVAAASRVITTLDTAPATAVAPTAPVVLQPSAPARRAVRPPIFRFPYARAAALLLLVGGTALVVDRSGTLARGKSSQAESLTADVATASQVAPAAAGAPAISTAPVPAPAPAAATDLSTGEAVGGVTGKVAGEDLSPRRAAGAASAADGGRARSAVPRAPAAEPVRAALEQRAAATGAANKDSAAPPAAALAASETAPPVAQAPTLAAVPPPPPMRGTMRLEEVVVTGVSTTIPRVARYRTKDGTVVTLTEEPLRTSFAEDSTTMRRSISPQAQQRAAAAMASPAINSYRWSSAEHGKTYTLSGPLTVAELEALSRRLSELERLP
jgi:anti-sigma factor RsiW